MAHPSPVCPNCGQADKTYKVSLLYLESAARLKQRQEDNQPELDQLLDDLSPAISSQEDQHQLLAGFARAFSPPEGAASGQKQTFRRVHPDTMIIFFALFSLLIVYQVAVSQPAQLPIIAILLVGGLLAYLLTRKKLVQRFEDRVRREQEENKRLETAMTRWMHLYFCSRDKGVFDPAQNRFAPLEQMSDLYTGI